MKRDRNDDAVQESLARLRKDAADQSANLMPSLLDTVRTHVTLGEIVGALADVFGRWVEDPRI